MRLLMLFALATLAVIGVIAVLFIGNFRQSQRDSIVLPDAAQSAQPAAQQPGEEPSLLEVSRSNVQSIVRYLHRPQYYHQSYTITRQMGGAASESTAELWVSDTRVCAVLTSAAGEKHLLTDGQTLYVWYASDEKVRQLPVAADVTMDELTGIPTYELLDTLPPETITDGEFITDDRYDSGQQIFVAAEEDTVRRAVGLLRSGLDAAVKKPPYDDMGLELIGPAPAPVVRVNGSYRYRLLLLGENNAQVRGLLSSFMRAFAQRAENRRLHIRVDCDLMD